MALWKKEGRPVDRWDLIWTSFFIGVVRADVNVGRGAFYNFRVREDMLTVGIDPDLLTMRGQVYADSAYKEVKKLKTT